MAKSASKVSVESSEKSGSRPATKVPGKPAAKAAGTAVEAEPVRSGALQAWRPFESLRREVDRLFEDFGQGFWRFPFPRPSFDLEPFGSRALSWGAAPAVDIAEKDDAYEVKAELPGLDEKHVEVHLDRGVLTIKGEKQEDREEKKKGYHLRERHFGSFERSFSVPEDVDADKIAASFRKGVLTVTLPRKAGARRPAKKIEVKGD